MNKIVKERICEVLTVISAILAPISLLTIVLSVILCSGPGWVIPWIPIISGIIGILVSGGLYILAGFFENEDEENPIDEI